MRELWRNSLSYPRMRRSTLSYCNHSFLIDAVYAERLRLTPRFAPNCFHCASTDGREMEKDTMPKLTKRSVESFEVRPKSYFEWDSEIKGFGLRIMPSGTKT